MIAGEQESDLELGLVAPIAGGAVALLACLCCFRWYGAQKRKKKMTAPLTFRRTKRSKAKDDEIAHLAAAIMAIPHKKKPHVPPHARLALAGGPRPSMKQAADKIRFGLRMAKGPTTTSPAKKANWDHRRGSIQLDAAMFATGVEKAKLELEEIRETEKKEKKKKKKKHKHKHRHKHKHKHKHHGKGKDLKRKKTKAQIRHEKKKKKRQSMLPPLPEGAGADSMANHAGAAAVHQRKRKKHRGKHGKHGKHHHRRRASLMSHMRRAPGPRGASAAAPTASSANLLAGIPEVSPASRLSRAINKVRNVNVLNKIKGVASFAPGAMPGAAGPSGGRRGSQAAARNLRGTVDLGEGARNTDVLDHVEAVLGRAKGKPSSTSHRKLMSAVKRLMLASRFGKAPTASSSSLSLTSGDGGGGSGLLRSHSLHRRMSVSQRNVAKIKLDGRHDKERLIARMDRERARQKKHSEERLKRRATKLNLLNSEQGQALAALATRTEKHDRMRRASSRLDLSLAGILEASKHKASQPDGPGGQRRSSIISTSSRRLREIREEGNRDREDLVLAMEQEKARQHEHMMSRLKKRKESHKKLLEEAVQ